MKDFKDIQEGLLRGMEDTLDAGENTAQQVLKDQMLKYFVTNTTTPRKMFNNKQSFIYFYDASDIDKAIDKYCSYDGNVLTIDTTKSKKDLKIRISTLNGGIDLPKIKIIDKAKTEQKGATPDMCNFCNIIIVPWDDEPVDVEAFIHPESNISSIAFDRSGNKVCTYKTNRVPGTVRDLAAYYCKFEKVYTNEWPKSKHLWFSQEIIIDIFRNAFELNKMKYDLGYPTRNLLTY